MAHRRRAPRGLEDKVIDLADVGKRCGGRCRSRGSSCALKSTSSPTPSDPAPEPWPSTRWRCAFLTSSPARAADSPGSAHRPVGRPRVRSAPSSRHHLSREYFPSFSGYRTLLARRRVVDIRSRDAESIESFGTFIRFFSVWRSRRVRRRRSAGRASDKTALAVPLAGVAIAFDGVARVPVRGVLRPGERMRLEAIATTLQELMLPDDHRLRAGDRRRGEGTAASRSFSRALAAAIWRGSVGRQLPRGRHPSGVMELLPPDAAPSTPFAAKRHAETLTSYARRSSVISACSKAGGNSACIRQPRFRAQPQRPRHADQPRSTVDEQGLAAPTR